MCNSAVGSIHVPIVGGLGNQLFLIATGVATALRNRMNLSVPHVSFSDSCAHPRPVYWDSMLQNISPKMRFVDSTIPMLSKSADNSSQIPSDAIVIPETSPEHKIIVSQRNKTSVLRGFFQSAIYFDDFEQQVKSLIVPKGYIARAQKCLETMLLHQKNQSQDTQRQKILGIHIRRGDYLTMRDVFPILSPQNYYFQAIEALYGAQLLDNSSSSGLLEFRVVIFTEDKVYGELFRDMLRSRYPLFSKDLEAVQISNIKEDYLELLAMSLCDDLIIANSSFSWWGAYLNSKPLNRVIAPRKWFVGRSPNIQFEKWTLV